VTDIVCRIIAGELPAQVVLRTPEVIAFLDHRPVFKGHLLICPIRHVTTLLDLPEELMTPLLVNAQRVAAAMGAALGADGTFVAMNNVISQSVPHLHLHVVPRRKGDGLRGFFWPRTRYAAGEEADYAQRLRAELASPGSGTHGSSGAGPLGQGALGQDVGGQDVGGQYVRGQDATGQDATGEVVGGTDVG